MPQLKKETPAERRCAQALVRAAKRLNEAVADYPRRAPTGQAVHILNPLDYAWAVHKSYLRRYGGLSGGRAEAVFVGMNPGPWGMAQSGVPFGSPDKVRDFLGLAGEVRTPGGTHPKRPILGLDSARTEVSGQRLWGGIEACFRKPERFFRRFFVGNYCPLVFQSATGANVTPDKLPREFMSSCEEACDEHMLALLSALQPRTVIGVGKWAEKRLRLLVERSGLELSVGSILHPSPASPLANKGWLPAARRQLVDLGHAWPEPA